MPTQQESDHLWQALWNKYLAIVDAEKALFSVPMDERPNYEWLISSLQAEAEAVSKAMEAVSTGAPLPFPSDGQIAQLQHATGTLARAVNISAGANAVVQAATDLLQTWPVSQAG